MVEVYLASRSPRRRELLAGLGLRFEALGCAVDERRAPGEAPARYVERMAREKALAGAAALPRRAAGGRPPAVVLGADTIVVLDGDVLGKPRDGAETLRQLERLSGRGHEVLSAVAAARCPSDGAPPEVRLSPSRVWLRRLTAAERIWYRDTGEPADKAGSYAIQGLAAAFVTRLEGSWSAVVGLPLYETVELLRRAGAPFPPPAADGGGSAPERRLTDDGRDGAPGSTTPARAAPPRSPSPARGGRSGGRATT